MHTCEHTCACTHARMQVHTQLGPEVGPGVASLFANTTWPEEMKEEGSYRDHEMRSSGLSRRHFF